VAYFGTITQHLFAAEEQVGVRHHVLLSIAAVDRVEGDAHYVGKWEQERLVTAGPVLWTIVPATRFHDFAATLVSWTEQDGVATIPPLLVQPIVPADVADVLAEIATGTPQERYRDIAGPELQDLVDMARRTNDARGHAVKLVPSWSSPLGPEMAGDVLLPGEGARTVPTTFGEWLAKQRESRRGGPATAPTRGGLRRVGAAASCGRQRDAHVDRPAQVQPCGVGGSYEPEDHCVAARAAGHQARGMCVHAQVRDVGGQPAVGAAAGGHRDVRGEQFAQGAGECVAVFVLHGVLSVHVSLPWGRSVRF